MRDYFAGKKQNIVDTLKRFLKSREQAFTETGRFGTSTLTRLFEYAIRGKMLRGCLVMLGHDLWEGVAHESASAVAAGLELFQSALLVHDDIMDRDTVRRGEPTIHVRFARECRAEGLADPDHIGEALAICSGDIAFFLGFQLLSSLPTASEIQVKILNLVSAEMSLVGSAQMQDAYNGALGPDAGPTSRDEIFNLYRFKTGRYTMALPLAAGLILAGAPDTIVLAARELGEVLGVMFQIKDDEMGLFGTEGEIGKPVGSDIREGKKTIFYEALMRKAPDRERRKIVSLIGAAEIKPADVAFVRDLVNDYGIRDEIAGEIRRMLDLAGKKIEAIDFKNKGAVKILEELAAYSSSRTS